MAAAKTKHSGAAWTPLLRAFADLKRSCSAHLATSLRAQHKGCNPAMAATGPSSSNAISPRRGRSHMDCAVVGPTRASEACPESLDPTPRPQPGCDIPGRPTVCKSRDPPA